MTTTFINPSATGGSLGGGTVTGAASLQQALRDGSDSSFVTLAGTHTAVDFPAPSAPAGSRILALIVYTRLDITTFGTHTPYAVFRNNLPDISGNTDITVIWVDNPSEQPTYISTDADANGAVTSWEVDLKKQSDSEFQTTEPVNLNVYKLWIGVTYVPKPVVTVANPTGTIGNTSFPLVTWSSTDDVDGGPTNKAQVRIFNSTQYGSGGFSPDNTAPVAGSGVLENNSGGDVPTQWRSTTKLPNATYRAYVRTKQDKSNWSDWAFHGFTQSVTAPADPTSVTVTPESSDGRMKIDVTGSDSPRSVDAIEIQRSIDGGTTWTPIRSFGADAYSGVPPVSAEVVAWDWEAPIATALIYRARTLHNYALGEVASSDWVQSLPAAWNSNDWWLKHPTDWTLDAAVAVHSQPSSNRAARQGIFTPLGRAAPVVVEDVRVTASGDISVRTLTQDEMDTLNLLVDAQSPLLIQADPTNGWPDRWVVLGDLSAERVVDGFSQPWFFVTASWQEVERPEGNIVAYPSGGPSGLTLPFTLGNSTLLH